MNTQRNLSRDDYINLVKSYWCYFNESSVPSNMTLVCYYCLNKSEPRVVKNFTYRKVNGQDIFDVPICPECSVDSLIDYDRIPGSSDKEKYKFLRNAHNVMFRQNLIRLSDLV